MWKDEVFGMMQSLRETVDTIEELVDDCLLYTSSGQKMVNVLNELLIAHEKYLPQFADKIAELKAAGVTIKDDVARELTEKGL